MRCPDGLFMRLEALLGKHLILSAWTAIISIRVYGYASARGEEACYFNIFRIHQLDKILHDSVDAVLMEIAVVTETEQIEFQALAFHHSDIRNITDSYFGEIRLSGNRTERRELRAVEPHPIVISFVPVLESLENLGSIIHFIFSLVAQLLQAFISPIHNNILYVFNFKRIIRDVLVECILALYCLDFSNHDISDR